MKFFTTVFVLFIINIAKSQEVLHGEILGRPSNNSIVIQIFFKDSSEYCIQYGIDETELKNQTNWTLALPDIAAETTLESLKSDQKYYYRIAIRKPGQVEQVLRPIRYFHTQRSPGNSFTFVIQADPHMDEQSDEEVYLRCLQNQLEDGADFMIDLGDIIMTDKLRPAGGKINRDTIQSRFKQMRNYYHKACHSVPLFIALGNHEAEAGWQLNGGIDNLAVWNTLERQKYLLNPSPDDFYSGDDNIHDIVGLRENYYSWTWGDALFIVLDPYWYTKTKPGVQTGWLWTLGKVQYDWLKQTLERSSSKFKFVFAHQLIGGDPNGRGGIEFANLYEWGGHNPDGSYGFLQYRPGWYKPIKDLLTENKVQIFFHGHDHFFGKQEKDCLIYQECPQPSHPNFQSVQYAYDYGYKEGLILPNSGHLRIKVSPDGVNVEYVRVYLARNETANRKNKDVSASYFLRPGSCYDTLNTSTTVVWNKNYVDEIVQPNPFYSSTTIEFSIQKNANISISIFDLKGNKIKKLLERVSLESGSYQIFWDGKSESGENLPPGHYLYSISDQNTILSTGNIHYLR